MKKIILSLLALSVTLSACMRQAPEATEASTEPLVSVTEESKVTDMTENSAETIVTVPDETMDAQEESQAESAEKERPRLDDISDPVIYPQEYPTVPQASPTEEVPETEPVKPAETAPPEIPAPTQAPEPEVPAETVPDAAEAPKPVSISGFPFRTFPLNTRITVLCFAAAALDLAAPMNGVLTGTVF